jgi:hypothetical protein
MIVTANLVLGTTQLRRTLRYICCPRGKMNHVLGANEALTIMEKYGRFDSYGELPMATTRSTLLV